MDTTNIKDEIRNKYNKIPEQVRLSGIESFDASETSLIPDADSTEGVALELSDEGRQKAIEMQNLKRWAEQMKDEQENANEHADEISKIMTIFRRIANGDIVPPKDESKLMEHSMEMYQAAKNLGSMKENEEKKKYKSVDEDEEENGAISQEEAIRALSDSSSGSSSENVKVYFE